MLVIRGTKKLRDRVKSRPADDGDVSTTVLGDWFATPLFWKPQAALLVNQRTFVSALVPLAPAATLLDRVPDAIAGTLRRLGADDSFVKAELDAMREVRIAPTNDRSVVGVMNELAFHGDLMWQLGAGTLEDVALELAGRPLGPLRSRSGFPDRELAAVLGIEHSHRHAATHTPVSRVFQLKVTLADTKPPIWRRVLVDSASTLEQLHEVIQAAFGWWNYHLFQFQIGRARYGVPDPEWIDFGRPLRDVRTSRLDQVAGIGSAFSYTYDFGDFWEHKLIVEKVLDTSPVAELPACTGGRRAAPPEDCGGVQGYEQLLAILADPTHPDHTVCAQWSSPWGGAHLDPDAFDPDEFAKNLRALQVTHSAG